VTKPRLDLSEPRLHYAVANDPMFLMEKLKADPTTVNLSKLYLVHLVDGIRESLKIKPVSLDQLTLPYVYLVALGLKRDIPSLQKATRLRANRYKWFSAIAKMLLNETSPTVVMDVRRLAPPKPSLQTSVGPTFLKLS
jgi:hypothetical protein